MYFLKSLISPRSRNIQQNRVRRIFSDVKIEGKGSLHPQYLKILLSALYQVEDETKCLKMLISKLQSLNSLQQIVKLFTLIHRLLIQRNYKGLILECIENAEIIVDRQIKLENQDYESWFIPFYRKYLYYLVRLASNAQIMIKTKEEGPQVHHNNYLSDLFRLLNQLNIVLSTLNSTAKTAGRYYGKKLDVFQQFFKVMQIQLTNVYKYLKVLITGIISNYQKLSVEQLEVFIKSVPEYEIMIDQLEDLLTCKYFYNKNIYSQPYVFAEDIARIAYQIECRKKQGKSKKNKK